MDKVKEATSRGTHAIEVRSSYGDFVLSFLVGANTVTLQTICDPIGPLQQAMSLDTVDRIRKACDEVLLLAGYHVYLVRTPYFTGAEDQHLKAHAELCGGECGQHGKEESVGPSRGGSAPAGSIPAGSTIPMLCPNCGCGKPRVLPEDAERGDLGTVTCPECHWKTDSYEAMKAAEKNEKART